MNTYANTGSLTAAFKDGLISILTAQAFETVGHGMGLQEGGIGQLIGHAAVGCGSSVMSGGKCISGALAAGFTKAFAGTIDGIQDRAWRTVAASIVGGTASVLGGGKFENGAITGAFSRLFNDEAVRRFQSRGDFLSNLIDGIKGLGCAAGKGCLPDDALMCESATCIRGGKTFTLDYSKGKPYIINEDSIYPPSPFKLPEGCSCDPDATFIRPGKDAGVPGY